MFRLGEWVVEPELDRLSRDGRAVRIEPKVMDVLVALASHPGTVVAKEQLIATVWNRRYLADSVLTRAVAELRRTLGDDARAPRYVQTIPKRGYRLIAPVRPLGHAPATTTAARRGNGVLVAAGFAIGVLLGWLAVRPAPERRRRAPRR